MFLLTIGFAGRQLILLERISKGDQIIRSPIFSGSIDTPNPPHIFNLVNKDNDFVNNKDYERNKIIISNAFEAESDYVVMLIDTNFSNRYVIDERSSDKYHYQSDKIYKLLTKKKQETNKKLLIYVLPQVVLDNSTQYILAAGDFIGVSDAVTICKFGMSEVYTDLKPLAKITKIPYIIFRKSDNSSSKMFFPWASDKDQDLFIENRSKILTQYETALYEVYTNRSKLFASEKMANIDKYHFTPKEWLDIHTSPSGLFDEIQNLDQFCQYAKSLGVLGFTGELNKDRMIFLDSVLRNNSDDGLQLI
jgi:hypothetical protein